MSAAPKSMWSISHAIQILNFPGNGEGSLLAVPPSISSSSRLVSGSGGRCGLFNYAKIWKTAKMNISRTILACLKENCYLPDFSRTHNSKAKAVMVKKKLRLLH